MENQHNKALEPALMALRQEIDNIDNQIIKLIGARMKVIDQVGELKKTNNEKFFIRSSREADMIKNLIKKSDSNFPKTAIVAIWRKIIAAANMHEQRLTIAIHNPKNISDYTYLVREYYDVLPVISHDSVTNIVAEIEKSNAQIGVFSLPSDKNDDQVSGEVNDNWWIGLANNKSGIKVFAKIPFVEKQNNKDDEVSLVAVAIKPAEKSQEDNSLFYVEVKKEVSRAQIIAAFLEQSISAKILKAVKLPQVDDAIFYLIESEGFYEEEDVALKNFSKSKIKPYIKVLGHYAVPVKF